ncbi:glycosyltransferase family 39 protein [Amycolatopsis suaedae]|nr:glycosyltransferase family 39 protein [Amycolatopsis suaedae]
MRTEPLGLGTRSPVEAPSPTTTRTVPLWWLGLAGCLALALALRIWGAASAGGWGNAYYAATALTMSQDWTAFLSGGLDAGHFISMDKPAVWLWPSALLIKLFGLNWATLFLPTAIAGVASVLVLALAVREAFGGSRAGRIAALLAGLGLAISPVNVAVDRANTPDAIMVLALLVAAWLTVRAVRRGRLVPLLGAAAMVGLAFDAKYLQAYLVLPALALVWLVCGPGRIGRRLLGAGGAAVTVLVTSAVWPLLVSLVPEGSRAWTAASPDGTILGRVGNVLGVHLDAPTAGNDMAGQIMAAFKTGEVFHSGPAGAGRLFSGALADQVSWWFPLAIVAAGATAVALRGRGRTDPAVAALLLWTGWAACCWAVFSFMGGVLHPYYTGMLVPALAALAAVGLVTAWGAWRRGEGLGTALLAAQIVAVTGWTVLVLRETGASYPGWLLAVVLLAGVLALVGIRIARGRAPVVTGVGLLAAVAVLAAPLTWSVRTADQQLSGLNPLANQEGRYLLAAVPPPLAEAFAVASQPPVDPRMVAFLRENHGTERWMVATLTAMSAAPLILAADGTPVLAMGGFDGSDPVPTAGSFRELVRSGQLRFVLAPPPGPGTAAFVSGPAVEAVQWAAQACRPVGAAPPPGLPVPVLLDCRGAA